MPYLILEREDGDFGYMWVDEDYTPQSTEVVVESEPDPETEVFDSATQSLREKTGAERLEEAKKHKVDEFAARAIDDLAPLFTDEHGKDETLHLAASHIVQICQALGITPDPRLEQVTSVGQKALGKKAQIEAATTEAELEAIEWKEPV